jgi:hypothetical protein
MPVLVLRMSKVEKVLGKSARIINTVNRVC